MRSCGERAIVYHPDYGEVDAVWSKASHVPLYGWARADQPDVEDWELLYPQPTVVRPSKTEPAT